MTDIAAVSTQIAKGTGPGAGAQSVLQGSEGGIFAGGPGVNFFDLIFSRLAASTETKNDSPLLSSQAGNLTEAPTDNPLTLLKLVLAAQQAEDGTFPEESSMEQTDLKTQQLEGRIEKLSAFLDYLTQGVPQDTGDTGYNFTNWLRQCLTQKIDKLQTQLEESQDDVQSGSEPPFPLLIALGLNPEQINKLIERIETTEEELGRDITFEDLVAGVVNLIPSTESTAGDMGDSSVLSFSDSSADENSLETRMNGLWPADGGERSLSRGADNGYMPFSATGNKAGADSGTMPNNASHGSLPQAAQTGGHNPAADFGDITLPQGWQSALFDGIEFSSFDIDSGLPLSPAAQAVHAATAIPQAGQTHPATQMVAAQMTKAAKDGSTTTMTIQMEPPELGRVEVRLEFGPDKTVRAHLLVEKPETFLMLQRDTAVLERALQSAGLETDSGGLEFTLADGQDAFEQYGERQGGGGTGNSGGGESGAGDAEDNSVLHTTMTWDVDPETGHVRYDILA